MYRQFIYRTMAGGLHLCSCDPPVSLFTFSAFESQLCSQMIIACIKKHCCGPLIVLIVKQNQQTARVTELHDPMAYATDQRDKS
jgi:hypothetical protein